MRSILLAALLGIFSISASATSGDCEAYFTYTIGEGGYVEFDNQSFWNEDGVDWLWWFGDEGSSNMSNPSFTFEPGTYNVCLNMGTLNCEDVYCAEITIPEPCNGLEITLESVIDPATLVEIAWLLENLEGADLDEGLIEMVLGGANGEISLCLPDGCYTLTLTGPEEFSFDIIILLMELADLPIEPLSLTLDGNTLIVEFSINSDCGDEIECPDQLWSGEGILCGCYWFELGSAADNPQVTWYFGDDGPYVEGHFADYCFEANGTYEVTATYSSETCPQETYTTEVVVACEGCGIEVEYEQSDCGEGVYEAFGYPENAQLFWYVDTDNEAYATGVGSIEVDLEPGVHWICVGYETPECPEWNSWCIEFVVDDCNDCPLEVIYEQDDCGFGYYEVVNAPENATIWWYLNNDNEPFATGNAVEIEFGPGENFICAAYETDACPDGVWWCMDFYIDDCVECPQEYGWGYTENCGCVVMEIGSFVEGEFVYWDFGDGTFEDGGHFADHCYEENGTYTVIAVYNSPYCQNETYTFEIGIDCFEEDDCPTEEDFWAGAQEGDCNMWLFEIGSFIEGESVIWYWGDESAPEEGGHFAAHEYAEDGVYDVCAFYTTPLCPDGVELCITIEVDCDGCPEMFDIYPGAFCQTITLCWPYEPGDEEFAEITVDWGDGNFTQSYDMCVTHTYDEPGTYVVTSTFSAAECGNIVVSYTAEVEISCVDPCALLVDIAELGCGGYWLEAYDFPAGSNIWWTVDGVVVLENNHVFNYQAEDEDSHVICAMYEMPDCPNGAQWCQTFTAQLCEGDCPDDIWMSEGFYCGCYEFEIGSFVEGESVVWDFGDGTEIEGGHYIEYCYEEDGEYVVTAWYESSECEGMLYTLGVANVECDEECVDVVLGMDSYLDLGGPSWVEWAILDWQEMAVASGACEYGPNYPYCDAVVCLDAGCYQFIAGSETALNNDNFGAFIDSSYEGFEIIEGPYYIDDFHVAYDFAIDADCNESDCDLTIDLIEGECEWVYFEASDFPAGTTLWWEIDDTVVQEGGDGFDWAFEEDGWHVVCVFYETPDCPLGVWACEEVFIEFCTDCPTDLWGGELDECGCFEFEFGSFQEGESVDWYWGDGTEDLDAGHYAQHCYDVEGIYVVEVVFTSDICPDGVTAVYTVEFDCDDCTEVGFAFDSFADLGGPEYIEWAVSTADGVIVEDGGCEYVNSPYCDAGLCLEDGCYQMDIWFPTPITSDDAFFSAAYIAGEQLPYQGDIVWDGESHMIYYFGVNADCGDNVWENQAPIFEVYPVPANDILNIRVSPDLTGSNLTLFDAQGRVVIDQSIFGENELLYVNSLAQGLYTAVVLGKNTRIASKIQILR